jgi:hypothetical protein
MMISFGLSRAGQYNSHVCEPYGGTAFSRTAKKTLSEVELARSTFFFCASTRPLDLLVQTAALAHDKAMALGSFDRFSTPGKRGDVELHLRSS